MASGGFAALGTELTFNSKEVKELTRISLNLGTADDIDLTSHSSSDDTEEFVPGIIRTGTVDIEGVFVPTDTGQQEIITDLQAKTSATIVVTCPDSGGATFSGTAYPKSFTVDLPYSGKAAFTASFRVSGKLAFTA